MLSAIIGALLNCALDPVFIFALDMGMRGAAAAAVVSQAAGCAFVLIFLFSKKIPLSLSFGGYHLRIMLKALKIGLTPFLIAATDNLMIIAMNAVLRRHSPEFYASGKYASGVHIGRDAGVLAYNYGPGRLDRVQAAQEYIFRMCALFTAVMTAAAFLVFTSDPQIAARAVRAIRICSATLIPLGIHYEVVDGFTALGMVRYSLSLSFFS